MAALGAVWFIASGLARCPAACFMRFSAPLGRVARSRKAVPSADTAACACFEWGSDLRGRQRRGHFGALMWSGGVVQTGGIGLAADREWIVQNAQGRRFVYDSEAEAFEELDEYGDGAVVLTRLVYRGLFRTKPLEDWQRVERPEG